MSFPTSPGAARIEEHYRQQYNSGITQMFQQESSLVFGQFEQKTQSAEWDHYDRISPFGRLKPADTRYGENPQSEIDFGRRRIGYSWFDNGKMIDPKDLKRVATDPTSAITSGLAKSAARERDHVFWNTIYAPAFGGKTGTEIVNFVTPTSGKVTVGEVSRGTTTPISTGGRYVMQAGSYEGIVIASDYTGSTAAETGITLAKLKAARTTMLKLNSIQKDDVLDIWLASDQFEQLLGIDEVINADYSVRKNLAAGNVTEFMGYRFRHSELVPYDAAGKRRCLIARPEAYYAVTAQEITADMWLLPDKKNIPYAYIKVGLGGSRMWGEITCEVKCND